MKNLLRLLSLFAFLLHAHDHIDAGVDPEDNSRLAMEGPAVQIATYFPPGELVSFYSPNFPGGTFANELTFSVEGEGALEIPDAPSQIAVEILSVEGPASGHFSFWEVNALSPTFTRPVGWVANPEESAPRLIISEAGGAYGHIHGRLFTFTRAGEYTVRFRAIDLSGTLEPSGEHLVLFRVLEPPRISPIFTSDGTLTLRFESRNGLTYDLQKSTNLLDNIWENIGFPVNGNGELLEVTDPDPGNMTFYRLVEYR